MKKLILSLTLLFVLLTCCTAALAANVPLSRSEIGPVPPVPDAPEIVRCVHSGRSMTIRFDRALPSEHFLSFEAVGVDHRSLSVRYAASGSDYVTEDLPNGGGWMGIELAWVSGGDNALATYSTGGGLVSVTQYDGDFNGFVFNSDGKLTEYQDESSGVWVRFDQKGKAYSYSYESKGMRVWFDLAGNVLFAKYEGDGYKCTWEPDRGWYIITPTGFVKAQLDLNPRSVRPLVVIEAEPTPTVRVVWYRDTINVAGLSLQEADPRLPDKWYNVVPIDLTHDGRQTYFLTVSNARFFGKCYVDVWGDEVTVSCDYMEQQDLQVLKEYARWFTSLSEITTASIESDENAIRFGEPVSISRDLDGAQVALLFVRGRASYRQPFRDGTEMTRYWRNTPDWKAFRKRLGTLMPYVAP